MLTLLNYGYAKYVYACNDKIGVDLSVNFKTNISMKNCCTQFVYKTNDTKCYCISHLISKLAPDVEAGIIVLRLWQCFICVYKIQNAWQIKKGVDFVY